MALAWGETEFVLPTDAISVDHENIAITAVLKDDHTLIAWSIKVNSTTWPEAEEIAKVGAELLARWLRSFTDYQPDGDG